MRLNLTKWCMEQCQCSQPQITCEQQNQQNQLKVLKFKVFFFIYIFYIFGSLDSCHKKCPFKDDYCANTGEVPVIICTLKVQCLLPEQFGISLACENTLCVPTTKLVLSDVWYQNSKCKQSRTPCEQFAGTVVTTCVSLILLSKH